jgi:hypothetical protein
MLNFWVLTDEIVLIILIGVICVVFITYIHLFSFLCHNKSLVIVVVMPKYFV